MNPSLPDTTSPQFRQQYAECVQLARQKDEQFLEKCQLLLKQAEVEKDWETIGGVYILIGRYHTWCQDYNKSIESFQTTLDFAEKHQLFLISAEANFRLSINHFNIGDFGDHTLNFALKAIKICEQIGNQLRLAATCQIQAGIIYRMRDALEDSESYFLKALSYFENNNEYLLATKCYRELSLICLSKTNIVKALGYIHKSMSLSEKSNNIGGMIESNRLLSQIHLYLNDFENAHKYADASIRIAQPVEENSKRLFNLIYIKKGEILHKQKHYPQALKFYEKALSHSQQIGQQDTIAKVQLLIAETKMEQGQLEEALELTQIGLRFFEKSPEPKNFAWSYLSLGILHNRMKKHSTAIEFLLKALEIEKHLNHTPVLYEALADAYNGIGNTDKAYHFMKVFVEKSENLYGEKTRELLNMQHERDMTLKEKETELLQFKNQELETINELKSRFFTNISHELRTPLTLILGPVESLLQEEVDFKTSQIQRLRTIRRNGKNMLQLIDEVLDISRLDVGKLQLEEKEVVLTPMIRRIFQSFESAAKFKKQDYQLSIWSAEQLKAVLDSSKLEKILNNLLSNAVKYTPKSGKVLLLVEEMDDTHLSISIKDTGRGIHPDDLPHIFDRYFQTHQKELPLEGGVGIGLAFVKELVEIMGGTIQVRSKWQQGSVFTLKIPFQTIEKKEQTEEDSQQVKDKAVIEQKDTSIKEEPPISPKLSAINSQSSTILIVEDHPEMLQYIQSVLDSQYNLQTVHNGEEAWQILQQANHSIDLIVSDVMMPQMDGFTLLEKIKQIPNLLQIPVILLTARTNI
ncbi:MAG: ATP-binding protein, partial [Chitinophagales bacterium]